MGERGFTAPEEDEGAESDEDDPLDLVDEFISKIATMLTSLLEGEEDTEILSKMSFSLQMSDLKDRMLNVFGTYLREIDMYPPLGEDDDEDKPTSKHSEAHGHNFLSSVSMTRVEAQLVGESFEGSIAEAFEIFILIQKLAELPEAAKHSMKSSFTADQFKVHDFLRTHTGRIEVARDGQLFREYFAIRPTCTYMSRAARVSVMTNVNRESQ